MSQQNYWMRANRRASRRAVLRGAGAASLGIAGAALIGCGGGDDDAPAPGATSAPGGTTAPGGTAAPGGAGPATVSRDDWASLSAEELLQVANNANMLENLPGQVAAMRDGPTWGGTLRFNRNAPTSFDVHGAGATGMAVHPGTHNSLITFDWKGDFGPQAEINTVADLPESLEQPDELTLTFTLRDEPVYFHDIAPVNGRELTAEDVKYSIEKLKEAPFQGPTYRDIEAVEVADEKTVVVKFARPAAYFLRSSCIPVQWIVAQEQVDSDEGLAPRPIGTGAFQIVEATRDVGVTYERNPRYFKTDPIYNTGKKLPYLDRLEGVFLPDLASYSAAWASGQVDYGSAGSDQTRRQVLDTLNLRPDAVIAITTPPPSAQPLIVINSNTPPFDDERVRRAMSMAVDRTALLEGVAGGLASPGYGQDWNYFDRPLGSQPWTVEELGQYYQYNPDEAVKMLQAAGFEKGVGRQVELGFSTNTEGARNATYLAMSDFLQQIGIEINIVTAADGTAYSAKLYGAEYKDLHVGIPRPAWDPDGFTYEQLHSQSTANFYNVNDPTLDELCEQQQQLFDVDERRAVLTQIMERDLDQAYRLWGINYYKIMMRDPKLFNAADHYLAWMTPGWGELKYELGWKQA